MDGADDAITPDDRPATPDDRPYTPDNKPATPYEHPSPPERPSSPNDRPASPDSRPAVPDHPASPPETNPTSGGNTPPGDSTPIGERPGPPGTPLSAEEAQTVKAAEQGIEQMRLNAQAHELSAKLYGEKLGNVQSNLKAINEDIGLLTERLKGDVSPARKTALESKVKDLENSAKRATAKIDKYQKLMDREMQDVNRYKSLQEATKTNIQDLKASNNPGKTAETSRLVEKINASDKELAELKGKSMDTAAAQKKHAGELKDLQKLDAEQKSNIEALEKKARWRKPAGHDAKMSQAKGANAKTQAKIQVAENRRSLARVSLKENAARINTLETERIANMQRLEVFDMNEATKMPFRSGDALGTPAQELGLSRPGTPPQAPIQAGEAVKPAAARQGLASVPEAVAEAKPVELFSHGALTEAGMKPASALKPVVKGVVNGVKTGAVEGYLEGWRMTSAASNRIVGAVNNGVKGAVRYGRTIVQPVKAITAEAAEAAGRVAGEAVGEVAGTAAEAAGTVGAGVAGAGAEAAGAVGAGVAEGGVEAAGTVGAGVAEAGTEVAGTVGAGVAEAGAEVAGTVGAGAAGAGAEVASVVGAEVAAPIVAEAAGEAGLVVLGEMGAGAVAEVMATAIARTATVAVGIMVRGALELVAGPIGMAIGLAWMAGDFMYHTIKAAVMEHKCHDTINRDYKAEFLEKCKRPPASVPTRLKMWKEKAFDCEKLFTEEDYKREKLHDERGAQDLADEPAFYNTHYIQPGTKPCEFGWYAKRDLDLMWEPVNITLITADGNFLLEI